MTITPASMIVYRGYDGAQNQIQTTSTPAAATRQYKSNNTAIATVTSVGLVKGVKAGSTKIIVSIPGATKECSVTAKKAGSVVITAKINGMSRICNVRVTN